MEKSGEYKKKSDDPNYAEWRKQRKREQAYLRYRNNPEVREKMLKTGREYYAMLKSLREQARAQQA